MKNTSINFIFILIVTVGCAQTGCSKFYPFSEGTKSQVINYNAKNRPTAIVDYTVQSVTKAATKETAMVQAIVADEKGREMNQTTFEVSCDGNKVAVDFKSMLNPHMVEQFKNMEYDISGTNLEYPNSMDVGQTLPNASLKMKIAMSGINMELNMDISDRKVIGEETVTTPAGTFDCFVIEYRVDVKMGINQSNKSKQWIAAGVGMVKQEDYGKNGKLTSSSMLTAFSR